MEKRYMFWLCCVPGLYSDTRNALLSYFGSAEKIFKAPEEAFQPWKDLKRGWVGRLLRVRSEETIDQMYREMQKHRVHFTMREEPGFPEKLKYVEAPPCGIFYKGALPDPDRPSIAVVGARSCSSYGAGMARQIGHALAAAGVQVISGMALGIDGIAQAEAVRYPQMSFAVVGCGLDICYPSSHLELFSSLEENGGIISEFPCGTAPLRSHFPMRNRLISGLADKLVVVEARKNSGSLITAGYALSQGKDVFAVPGRTDDPLSRGCNALIADGASIVVSTEDLMADLTEIFHVLDRYQNAGPLLAPSEELVYSNTDLSPRSMDELMKATGLAPGQLSEALLSLELKGLVLEIGRNEFARKQ